MSGLRMLRYGVHLPLPQVGDRRNPRCAAGPHVPAGTSTLDTACGMTERYLASTQVTPASYRSSFVLRSCRIAALGCLATLFAVCMSGWGDDDVTVHVYRLRGSYSFGQRGYRSYEPPWFGLTADTEDELHSLAEAIGLYRHFYRPRIVGGATLPVVGHYDLDEGERHRAVAMGARPITARQHARMLRQRVRELGVSKP
jgi:Protein of unknown function (DUF4031)